jgi:hypothetical protein
MVTFAKVPLHLYISELLRDILNIKTFNLEVRCKFFALALLTSHYILEEINNRNGGHHAGKGKERVDRLELLSS